MRWRPSQTRTALESVHDRLRFNVDAYGEAWTGEMEDTTFIARPLLDEVARLRALWQDEALITALYEAHTRQDVRAALRRAVEGES
jgi:hypothetical protein